MAQKKPDAVSKANAVARSRNADVLFFNSGTDENAIRTVRSLCGQAKRRPSVLLVLITPGGDARAAYLIARCLQKSYGKIIVFVPGWCKSAGTLLAIAANELVIGDCGELGPLDVQLPKRDELGEVGSGLIVSDALEKLESDALDMWRDYALDIVGGTEGQVSFKTAADIAAKISIGLFSKIYEDIDPMHLGEVHRMMKIGSEYGKRLATFSGNISQGNLKRLVEDYPDHSFAIDRAEAERIFGTVSAPSAEENALALCLGENGERPLRNPVIGFLSEPVGTSKKKGGGSSEAKADGKHVDTRDTTIHALATKRANFSGN